MLPVTWITIFARRSGPTTASVLSFASSTPRPIKVVFTNPPLIATGFALDHLHFLNPTATPTLARGISEVGPGLNRQSVSRGTLFRTSLLVCVALLQVIVSDSAFRPLLPLAGNWRGLWERS